MIIYIDMVFILNVFLDFILLISVSVILTRNTSIKRILLGSLLGGMSTFILYFSISSSLLFIIKIILGILMVLLTFGYYSIKYTLNNLFYLFTTSFILGGVLYLFINNGLYNLIILIIVFITVCFLYIKQLKNFKTNYGNYYPVKIIINGIEYNLVGYLDTGNKLYDNYKHRPIILVSKKINYQLEDIIYVSYISVNNECIMKCLKVDKIIIHNKVYKNYLIGLVDNKIKIDGVNCILHSQMKGDLHV